MNKTVKKDDLSGIKEPSRPRVKFSLKPKQKMRIAAEAYSSKRSITDLSEAYTVSRPTIYAWLKRLRSRSAVMAVFGDHKGHGTIEAVRAQREELRNKLKRGTRKHVGTTEKRYGLKKCPACNQFMPKKR